MTAINDDRARLAAVADDYWRAYLAEHPETATALGISGYEAQVSDPSREADHRYATTLHALEQRLHAINTASLPRREGITWSITSRRFRDEQATLAAGLREVTISGGIAGELSTALARIPRVVITDDEQAQAYRHKLDALAGYFDALAARYRQAKDDGRYPTARGVDQAIRQINAYVDDDLGRDPLLRPALTYVSVCGANWRAQTEHTITDAIRPALRRLSTLLADEILPVGRDDNHVGLCFVRDGQDAYRSMIRFHTTTDMSAEQIHDIGHHVLAELRAEIAEAGASVLGSGNPDDTIRKLRDYPLLRRNTAEEIVAYMSAAYHRAEQAMNGWFHPYQLPPCEIRQIDPIQARGSTAAYYYAPASDGSRPGTLWVNAYQPEQRSLVTYEAYAFHEGLPGHHLQFNVVDDDDLPDFRRYLKATAHSEGWGLYAEQLADEMELYSSETARLGMLTNALLRACRLVVDTGMHYYGWSRQRAVDYMIKNCAITETDVGNEIDRYIAAPGQALAYLVGAQRIHELRARAQKELGPAFDIADFHHRVLADGSVPLETLEQIIEDWIIEAR